MFEISLFCIIFLAVSYWAVLWLMGRREDVLHGEFVKAEARPDEPVRPVFPAPPARTVIPEQPAKAAVPPAPAFRSETLESLLNSIKRDLNQIVQK